MHTLNIILLSVWLQFNFLSLTGQTPKDEFRANIFIENPRPKGMVLDFRKAAVYSLNLQSKEFGPLVVKSTFNELKRIKLEVPILLKPKHQLFLGLKASKEEFEFEDEEPNEYVFIKSLQENALFSLGINLTYRKKLENDRFWILRGGLDINGDILQLNDLRDNFKYNLIFVYGIKKDERTEMGFGAAFTYDLGAPFVYPAFIFNKNWGKRWRANLTLLKRAELQYAFSPKMYAYVKLEVAGASYYLSDRVLADLKGLEFRYSEFRAALRIEREIHDWLWISGELGGFRNLRLYVSHPGDRIRNSLVRSTPFFSNYVRFNIFMVPPRKLFKKKLGF